MYLLDTAFAGMAQNLQTARGALNIIWYTLSSSMVLPMALASATGRRTRLTP
jgi:hypothetical protein